MKWSNLSHDRVDDEFEKEAEDKVDVKFGNLSSHDRDDNDEFEKEEDDDVESFVVIDLSKVVVVGSK